MNTQPLVSVIIITRNRPQYLKECLHHFKRQDYANFETIVVDSSPNSETKKVIREYENIKYVRFYNGRNMAVSRNIGINNAKGEIIAFLDDDCYVQPNWLRELAESFKDKRIGVVGGRVLDKNRSLYTPDSSKVGRISHHGITSGFQDYDGDKSIFVDYIPGGNVGFRKNILVKLGGFDPVFCEWDDVDISMRTKNAGYLLISNPKVVVFHDLASRELIKRDRSNPRSQYIYNRNHSYCLFKNRGFKLIYFKTIFYWKFVDSLKGICRNPSIEKTLFMFAQLFGSIVGVALAIKIKFCGERDYLILVKG